MPALARLLAVLAAALPYAAALAQEAGGRDVAAPRAGYAWLWILVAALVVVAIFRVLLARNRRDRTNPPARTP